VNDGLFATDSQVVVDGDPEIRLAIE